MIQTDTHPATSHPERPAMRDRAQALIAAFDALPAPQTLTDMLRTARLLMALDRLLSQIWKAPAGKAATKQVATASQTPSNTTAPEPLNRRQRRALEALNKTGKAKEAAPGPSSHRSMAAPVGRYASG